MIFNPNPIGNTGAELILDFSVNPTVNSSYAFTFEVMRGSEIIESESFTIRIVDCTTEDFQGSAFIPVVDWPPTSQSLFADAGPAFHDDIPNQRYNIEK